MQARGNNEVMSAINTESKKSTPSNCVECGVSMGERDAKKHMAAHYNYTKEGGFERLTEDQKARLTKMGVDF